MWSLLQENLLSFRNKKVTITADIMKTTCQLYLFMHLFRFAASCRFFFAWQQTHWLNCYFCLPDASCELKNQRCSRGKTTNCLSLSSHTDSSWWAAALFQVLLRLKHHERLHHVPRSQRRPRSSWPTFSINTAEHPAHIHPTFLFMSTFIYYRTSGGFRAVKSDLCYFLSLQVYIFKMIQCFQKNLEGQWLFLDSRVVVVANRLNLSLVYLVSF